MAVALHRYSAYVDKSNRSCYVQIDSVFRDSVYLYLAADVTLAVQNNGFWATPGDGNDTLHWVTESERENLGFMLYRRAKPEFRQSHALTPD